MKKISDTELQNQYRALDGQMKIEMQDEKSIRSDLLLTFPYQYSQNQAEITINTEEFTALCPWTGLPDHGVVHIVYTPVNQCIELKSLKFYLLSFRQVGIVQEHAANRILQDLVQACKPRSMSIELDYRIRGGLHTVVRVKHPAK